VVVRQGDPGDKFYLIRRGEVRVIKDGRPYRILSKGEFFGDRPWSRGSRGLRPGRRLAILPKMTEVTLAYRAETGRESDATLVFLARQEVLTLNSAPR
jgi:CRP-like cAMP-binding protein